MERAASKKKTAVRSNSNDVASEWKIDRVIERENIKQSVMTNVIVLIVAYELKSIQTFK